MHPLSFEDKDSNSRVCHHLPIQSANLVHEGLSARTMKAKPGLCHETIYHDDKHDIVKQKNPSQIKARARGSIVFDL